MVVQAVVWPVQEEVQDIAHIPFCAAQAVEI
jgi:hypothetical protein